MMLSRSNRSLMVAIAFITMCAAMLFDAQGASAQLCCGFGIYNNTDCPYRVRLVTATVDTTFAVPTGGGSWTIPNCDPFHLIVRDACGVDHRLPQTIGNCVTIYLGPACCVEICKISDCRWETTVVHCLPCI